MALSLRFGAETGDGFSGGVDANLATVEHLDADDVEAVPRAGADDFGEAGDADPHQLALVALFRLFLAQLFVAGHLERQVHGGRVIAAVIGPAERALIRELIRWDEILEAQLRRVHFQLVGKHVHGSFDEICRFGDAKRAAIGDSARGFVRVYAIDFAEGFREIV